MYHKICIATVKTKEIVKKNWYFHLKSTIEFRIAATENLTPLRFYICKSNAILPSSVFQELPARDYDLVV